ncbi:tRNA uridine-5-carboxymethylaminomethyl(34) synthesis GTPase MnmE [Microvirga pudoricolor]|uniref:tRNA uridine-5-carboxymethylaminomethyl(34) synthesis GTPase MnmE n=1 Tax=Microvirga pudoricolor TaxID=2778729 RepID=UPI001E52FA6D|nr:tRNA uridine-5-carboxymethylaminomethyl(34) synthesis GTPase MnmE [Microvirga pudoricolor]
MHFDDTIFAVASGSGRAAVSVVRISGPACLSVLAGLTGGVPEPRRLVLRRLRDPAGAELDQALVAWMPGPRSFTGEDQAELHIHGGLASRAAVLRTLGAIRGCRPAEAGEFTRRAFLNGRMDLTQVEGLADLIDAETEAQRRQALLHLEGHLGQAAERWRHAGIDILAALEATLDFSDEDGVPDDLETSAAGRLSDLVTEIDTALANPAGERLREGLTVVLVGSPNAGKSTLLNALARRDVAIVSPMAGTTRDAIEVRCDLGGIAVTVVDTAGLRESDDLIEREGVQRARARARTADMVLWLLGPDDPAQNPPEGRSVLRVASKTDLGDRRADCALGISALTGEGMGELLEHLKRDAEALTGEGADAIITRDRHRWALEEASGAFHRALSSLKAGDGLELATEDVRLGVRALGKVTGRVDVEHVLDRLFAGFCIGK